MFKKNLISLIIIAGMGLAIGNIHPGEAPKYQGAINVLETQKKQLLNQMETKKKWLAREKQGTKPYEVLQENINKLQERIDDLDAKIENYRNME
jgi:hypothetical protein